MSEHSKPWILFVEANGKSKEALGQYFHWLDQEHVEDVLRAGCIRFRVAKLLASEGEDYKAQAMVEFASEETLQAYLKDHAPALRAKGLAHFGQDVQFVRKIGEVLIDSFPYLQSKEQVYQTLLMSYEALLTDDMPVSSRISSLLALIKHSNEKVSWVGFYKKVGEDLWVDSYQGKLACTFIAKGKGVCGAALALQKTIIVPDVEKFDGHIACEGASRSEIVVPFFVKGELWGVLDVDSYDFSAFDEMDQLYLEKLLHLCARGA